MEEIIKRLWTISESVEYFYQLSSHDKTHCYYVAKHHGRYNPYIDFINEKCKMWEFMAHTTKEKGKVGRKPSTIGEQAEQEQKEKYVREAAKYKHLSPVQYQINKNARWQRVANLKQMEVYRKNLREFINDTYDQVMAIELRDALDAEYDAVSNWIKKNIDSVL